MERRIFRSKRRDRMGDLGPSRRPQGSRSFLADDSSLLAAPDGSRQAIGAAASASNPLARALFARLAAALAAEEPRGEAFRRVALGADPYER